MVISSSIQQFVSIIHDRQGNHHLMPVQCSAQRASQAVVAERHIAIFQA
jgi:hypothetical protein